MATSIYDTRCLHTYICMSVYIGAHNIRQRAGADRSQLSIKYLVIIYLFTNKHKLTQATRVYALVCSILADRNVYVFYFSLYFMFGKHSGSR